MKIFFTTLMCLMFGCLSVFAAEKLPTPIYYYSFDNDDFVNTGSGADGDVEIPESIEFVPGKEGNAVKFDNTGVYLPFNSAKVLSKGVYSIAFWVNPSYTKNGMILEQNGGTGICLDWYWHGIRIRTDKKVNKYVRDLPVINRWTHVVFVYDRKKGGTCYYDGLKGFTFDGGGSGWFSGNSIKFGFFKGRVDELYIFDKVLTQEDVYELSGVTPPEPPSPDPEIKLVSPEPYRNYKLGSSIQLQAIPEITAKNARVIRVVFYSGSKWIGEATMPPYNFTWTDATPGMHYVKAKVWDSKRGVGYSKPVLVNVPYSASSKVPTPVVLAGSSRIEWLEKNDVSIQLEGRVFSKKTFKEIDYLWSMVQGPAPVQFDNKSRPDATATFTKPGVYMLRLTAKDANGKSSGDTVVTIYPESKDFGYEVDYLKNHFTQDLGFQYNFDGLAFNRFKAPPEPYVHPRIFMNPEDVPDLRKRLKTTKVGKYVMGRIRDRLTKQLHSSQYFENPDYQDAECKKWLMNNKALFAYDALVTLIDDDDKRGKALAKVFTASAEETYKQLEEKMPTTNYREDIQGIVGRQFMGITYDFLYNYMTKQQQATVRKTLALATSKMWSIGMDSLPASTASNWIPTHIMHLMFCYLAIEGEDGADPELYPRLVAGYENYMTVGFFDEGSSAEGLGKNTCIAELMIPLAKRGNWLIASDQARNHIEKFYAYSMVPWGESNFIRWSHSRADIFTWDETLGGCYNKSRYVDVPVLKYAFPDNQVIDTVNRFELQLDCARLHDFNIRFPYMAMDYMLRAICAEDYDGSATVDEALEKFEVLPLTYYAPTRGRIITRSDWTKNALQLHFQPRTISGGHSQKDRNKIIISALGRTWGSDAGPHSGNSTAHSVITVDDKQASTASARVVGYEDEELASFACGDARMPYGAVMTEGDSVEVIVNRNMNLSQKKFPRCFDSSASLMPDWNNSQKTPHRSLTSNLLLPKSVFRTAGIVRGKYPYALVIDNINIDDKEHVYNWLFYLGRGLENGISFDGKGINGANDWKVSEIRDSGSNGYDLILTDSERSVNMLIRVLHAKGLTSVESPDNGGRIVLNAKAVDPEFVILFYPFRNGDKLPETKFTGLNGELKVRIGNQNDLFRFRTPEGGRSRFQLSRAGKVIMKFGIK